MSTPKKPTSEGQPPAPPGFQVWPLHIAIAKAWQQQVSRQAFQQALAAQHLPAYYRRVFSSWN